MDEKSLKAEMRIVALEYMVMNVYVLLHRLFQTPPELIKQTNEKAREMLKRQTIPGLDAVSSDLTASELQTAVEKLIGGIEEMLGLVKK